MPTILLVEDDEPSRDVLARRLAKRGYNLVTTADAREALDIARTAPPQLILIDLYLPEISGWEVARRIRADHSTERIPIIAMTVSTHDDDRARAFAAGCDDYYLKPVDLPALDVRIQSLLR